MRWPFPAVCDIPLIFFRKCLEMVRVATNSRVQLMQIINVKLIMYVTYSRILGKYFIDYWDKK